MKDMMLVGDHPPRQKADPREDPFHPQWYGDQEERWFGARQAHLATLVANSKSDLIRRGR